MSSIKILVADDSQDARLIIVNSLSKFGYKIIEAQDGLDALAILRVSPPPTLILSDIQMPRMNGLRLLINLRNDRKTRDIPVILSSGEYYLEDLAEALGVAGYLPKPSKEADLIGVVHDVLAQQSVKGTRT